MSGACRNYEEARCLNYVFFSLIFMLASQFRMRHFSGHEEMYIKLIQRPIGSQMFDNRVHRNIAHQGKITSRTNMENTF